MFLAELCVRRPVSATMLILALVVVGRFSYDRLGLDLPPKIDRPSITNAIEFASASPEEMETQVTRLIEEAVSTSSGLEELRSATTEGNPRVPAVFALERDSDSAAQDVRDKVSSIHAKFPKDTDPPIVVKLEPDSAPILGIVIPARRDPREITKLVDNQNDRLDRERQLGISANLDSKVTMGEAVNAMAPKLAAAELPTGYTTRDLGRVQFLEEARANFPMAPVLAMVFVYMVLASQFESFVRPFTIMAPLPMALPFGTFSLPATGFTMNICSAIGVLMPVGVVKKNAIPQVDYTDVLRERGLERGEAVLKAGHAPLRPILMTTFSIIAGMLPIALGKGDGSVGRAAERTTGGD
jgi:multidrug efflux pump subunit AcrB